MDCIEQIWKLALGDNSPLANAAKSAADELDALRAQLAEAQEQISEFQQANADIHLWRTGYRRQLAEAQAEIARLKADVAGSEAAKIVWFEDCMRTEQQLAASQATNEKLRNVLKLNSFDKCGVCVCCGLDDGEHSESCDVGQALALPDDTTALNKLLAVVYEECVGICDRFGGRNMHPHECRDAIRALAKQKGVM